MLERALPIPQIALGEDLRTRERTQAFWDRVKEALRALVDFFASGGPMS
jgi:hypothetical protein